ncbi:hypothetical protein AMAG_05388 [Allomyces macrogynus ATCC 38327]|uniref:Uncharacterized protein n=1 Tax=Allomyces macrogynus (strain ATCC 38327) TaxID=578462 RepID=A0A0L0SBT0_ALLM3|nr:hypothetical protein AMAG_05388 [Allomyces macrogynus ATCC 38327]|eukprot:KNE59941.1 hypothetical protein AMAG_05388 [Allomyces macrogynus ATCC 38327]
MIFALVNVVAFILWRLVPLGLHVALLPLAFAVSRAAGLHVALTWTAIYTAEALLGHLLPAVLATPVSAVVSLANPLIAALPVLHWLGVPDVLPAPLAHPWVLVAFEGSMYGAGYLLAVLEALATVVVIKQAGAALKDATDLPDAAKFLVTVTIFVGYLVSLSVFWNHAHGWDAMAIVVVVLVLHAVLILIPLVAEPGVDDIPVFYVALRIAVSARPVTSPGTEFWTIEAAQRTSLLSKWADILDLPDLPGVLSTLSTLTSALPTLIPIPTLVALAYRSVILGAAAAVVDRARDTCTVSSTAPDEARAASVFAIGSWLLALSKPLLVVWYAHALVGVVDGVQAGTMGHVQWTEPLVSVAMYGVLLVSRGMAA